MANKNSGGARIPSWLTPLPPAAGGAAPKPPVANPVEHSPEEDSVDVPEKAANPAQDNADVNLASE
jgi:hypothetical protein